MSEGVSGRLHIWGGGEVVARANFKEHACVEYGRHGILSPSIRDVATFFYD